MTFNEREFELLNLRLSAERSRLIGDFKISKGQPKRARTIARFYRNRWDVGVPSDIELSTDLKRRLLRAYLDRYDDEPADLSRRLHPQEIKSALRQRFERKFSVRSYRDDRHLHIGSPDKITKQSVKRFLMVVLMQRTYWDGVAYIPGNTKLPVVQPAMNAEQKAAYVKRIMSKLPEKITNEQIGILGCVTYLFNAITTKPETQDDILAAVNEHYPALSVRLHEQLADAHAKRKIQDQENRQKREVFEHLQQEAEAAIRQDYDRAVENGDDIILWGASIPAHLVRRFFDRKARLAIEQIRSTSLSPAEVRDRLDCTKYELDVWDKNQIFPHAFARMSAVSGSGQMQRYWLVEAVEQARLDRCADQWRSQGDMEIPHTRASQPGRNILTLNPGNT